MQPQIRPCTRCRAMIFYDDQDPGDIQTLWKNGVAVFLYGEYNPNVRSIVGAVFRGIGAVCAPCLRATWVVKQIPDNHKEGTP